MGFRFTGGHEQNVHLSTTKWGGMGFTFQERMDEWGVIEKRRRQRGKRRDRVLGVVCQTDLRSQNVSRTRRHQLNKGYLPSRKTIEGVKEKPRKCSTRRSPFHRHWEGRQSLDESYGWKAQPQPEHDLEQAAWVLCRHACSRWTSLHLETK